MIKQLRTHFSPLHHSTCINMPRCCVQGQPSVHRKPSLSNSYACPQIMLPWRWMHARGGGQQPSLISDSSSAHTLVCLTCFLCVFNLSYAAFPELFRPSILLGNKTEAKKTFCSFICIIQCLIYWKWQETVKPLLEHSSMTVDVLIAFYSKRK